MQRAVHCTQANCNVRIAVCWAFTGVPYASPPVGKLRFMPPVTSAHWSGVKNALSPGPICPQKAKTETGNATEGRHHAVRSDAHSRLTSSKFQNQSEDCLYLNIYAPAIGRWSSRCNTCASDSRCSEGSCSGLSGCNLFHSFRLISKSSR